MDKAIRSVGMTKKPEGQAPTLGEIRDFFKKHCGVKTKHLSKIKKDNVDKMFALHPQKAQSVQGRVKLEKRKLDLPSPQVRKKAKVEVKLENN